MTDRDKIVEGLSICIENIDRSCPLGCPYYDKCTNYEARFIFQPLLRDTLKLLKEQEPVEPTFKQDRDGIFVWACGSCGAYMYHIYEGIDKAKEYAKYCRQCGRPVKWE